MSLRTGLVRVSHFSRTPGLRLPPGLFFRAAHEHAFSNLDRFLLPLKYPDEPNAVRRNYLPFIAELERIKSEPSPSAFPPLLTREQLITIMDLLATSGRPPDLACIRTMFSHLPVYFGVQVTPDLHSVVIAAMLRQGYVPLAQQWLLQIPQVTPDVKPTLDNFHTFLKGCPNHVFQTLLRDVAVQKTARAGVRPTNETFAILIRCIINNANYAKTTVNADTFTAIITDMKRLHLPADPAILALMVNYYLEHGFQVRADNIRNNYTAQFPDIMTPEEQEMDALHKQLAAASQQAVEHSLSLFRNFQARGYRANSATFRAILNNSTNAQDLLRVEEVLGVKATASEYAVLVNNNIRVRQLPAALAVYEAAKKSGISVVAGLVAPLIRSLTSGDKKPAEIHNTDLDTALTLYSELDEAFPVSSTTSPALSAQSNGPDIDIYTSLMRGLAVSSNLEIAQPIADTLLSEMKSRGIPATAAIKTSSLVLEMRTADTLETAFRRYRKSHGELTESGYLTVLRAFSRLSPTSGQSDLLEYYFQIVGDMRRAGFALTDRVYTDMLQQIGEIAHQRRQAWRRSKGSEALNPWAMPANMTEDLLDGVRYIHNLVSLDTTIQPDRLVWNQLMELYQRLQSFPEVFRVWEMLYFSEKFGPMSVSVILHACGHANEHELAKQIVADLMTDNYVLNLHNWNAYVECLCRTNQFSEALETICKLMGTAAQPVNPDASTVMIMLKLADTKTQSYAILKRIRRELPELWASLPSTEPQPENGESPEDIERPPADVQRPP